MLSITPSLSFPIAKIKKIITLKINVRIVMIIYSIYLDNMIKRGYKVNNIRLINKRGYD